MSKRIKVLYIAGLGRNGGTLLDLILGQLNGFFSLGEFKFAWLKGLVRNDLCSCGQPFQQCSFWQDVIESAFNDSKNIDAQAIVNLSQRVERTYQLPFLLAKKKPANYKRDLEDYLAITEKLYNALLEKSQARVLVNSSKFVGHALVLSKMPNVDLYVVHLVRDSRGSVFSWQKIKQDPGSTAKPYAPKYWPPIAALWWMYRNAVVPILKPYAKGYMFVRYEDFVTSPRKTIEEITDLLNEPMDESIFTDIATIHIQDTHLQSGSISRFKQGDVQIKLDDVWKRTLNPITKFVVTLLSWPLLWKYGYLKKPSA